MKNPLLRTGELAVFALGGLGEVGKNSYVYEIEDQIFIVDAGILFPDAHLLGIDYVIPDFTYLVENQERIKGLFITHAHEDHIGSIPYLLKQVKIPKIYAAGIAIDLIEHKLSEHDGMTIPKIEEFKSHYKYKFKNTEISFIRLNHSIPDMFGIVFKTEYGNIFHTGDFKIDFTPVGPPAEYDKIAQIGKEGVLLLLSDSTNVEREGLIPSESKVGKSISQLFGYIKGRIIIATFASNMYRIHQIIEASIQNNRKVAVFGRSMEKAIEVGQSSGYVKVPKDTFLNNENIKDVDPDKVVLLVTGSQGEPLAALSRIANGSHRQISAMKGDTVIFSSSPIPGNQESVNKTIDLLFRSGVEVITHGPITDTHASGHGSQNDLKMMISLTKPKYFIPMHGEHRMLKLHRDLAVECGVLKENILIMDNGDVAAINGEGIRIAGKVVANDVYIDGKNIGGIGSNVIRERRILSEEGLFSVAITLNYDKKIVLNRPSIVSRGFIYMKANEKMTDEIANDLKVFIEDNMKEDNFDHKKLKDDIIKYLQEKIYELTLRKPVIMPIITNLI